MAKPLIFEIDGMVVRAEKLDRPTDPAGHEEPYETTIWQDGKHVPHIETTRRVEVRSQYEVYVDDVLRGYVAFPNGWGGSWRAYSLELKWPNYNRVSWTGVLGSNVDIRPRNEAGYFIEGLRKWAQTKEDAIKAFAAFVKAGDAPTTEEVAAKLAKRIADEAAQVEQTRLDKIRYAAERAQRVIDDAEAKRVRDERCGETLAGLIAIREDKRQHLSNFEMMALANAIETFEKRSAP